MSGSSADSPGAARPETSWVYFPGLPADPAATEAKHRLAGLLRQLAQECATVDPAAAGAGKLVALSGPLAAVLSELEAMPRIDPRQRSADASLAERGPFVGAGNPIASPLHLRLDGRTARGWAVYGSAYEGGIGDMHGGAVMAAFDDLLGCVQMAGPVVGRTGTLTVRFRAPSPIGRRIDYVGRLDRVEGRKAFCSGEATSEGVLLAEAEAVFIAAANPL